LNKIDVKIGHYEYMKNISVEAKYMLPLNNKTGEKQ